MQSGIIQAELKDYKTSFSYFYEALEGSLTMRDEVQAARAFKYMLLSKVLLNLPKDVVALVNSKLGLKFRGKDVDAMAAVAGAYSDRDLLKVSHPMSKGGLECLKWHMSSETLVVFVYSVGAL